MKKVVNILLVIAIVAIAVAIVWWLLSKKEMIASYIHGNISDKTSGLYSIQYDSSTINELTGTIGFYNVSLQTVKARKAFQESTEQLPGLLFFIDVKEVSASGVDMGSLVQGSNISAKKILLNHPVIQIIQTGSSYSAPLDAEDSLALYQRILGNFQEIRADSIEVQNGLVIVSDKAGHDLVTLKNINISLQHFIVDEQHSYNNIISYFIKNVIMTVDTISEADTSGSNRMNITNVRYDAIAKTLSVHQVQTYKKEISLPVIELNDISISNLNTDAFIFNKAIKAGSINCKGGVVTIYKKRAQKNNAADSIEFTTDLVSAQVDSMKLGKTKIIIINETLPGISPLVFNDVTFIMTKSLKVRDGNTLTDIIRFADWSLSAPGFSTFSKDKLYRLDVRDIIINKKQAAISIGSYAVVPLLSEKQFVKHSKFQQDRYDMIFKNINLYVVNFNTLIIDNIIECGNATIQANIKIFNDRTLPENKSSKVGNAPYQLLLKCALPVYINRLKIINSNIAYKERNDVSKSSGSLVFTNVNGDITNITNIPERVKLNPVMKINLNCLLNGQTGLETSWVLPLTRGNGNYKVNGKLGSVNVTSLNTVTEPLAMVSMTSGTINSLNFSLSGNDNTVSCTVLMRYKDLKIEVLKINGALEVDKNSVSTFLANTVIINDNPINDNPVRISNIINTRASNKSFFNLLWKSIFKGVKQTTTGK